MIYFTRAWWINKVTELLLELSPAKRLAATRDRKLCTDLPITNLIRILNKDRLILARDHIQKRILKELNTVIQVERFEYLPQNEQDRIKNILMKEINKCSLKMPEPLSDIGIGRLVSLLHGISGNLPDFDHDETETQQTDADHPLGQKGASEQSTSSVSQR